MKRSLVLSTLAALVLAASASSQTGTFSTYGTACGGPSAPCLSANDTSPITLGQVTGASANFAILSNTGSTQRIVTGFGFYTKTSQSATTSVDCWIYSVASGGAPNAIIASSKIQMTTTVGWQKTGQLKDANGKNVLFVIIPKNTAFFLVFNNAQARCNPLPVATSGTTQTHYWAGPPNWSGPWNTQRWVYQVYCLGGASVPQLSNTGVPTINKTFSIDLSSAKSNTNSILVLGVQQTNISLTVNGAPGCSLYTNPLVLLYGQTSNAGARTVSFPVPNDTNLLSVQFYSQYVVFDNVNALGLLWTEGGHGTIGK